jgi:pSer/pThr/pTyr-binding forkhead associated (FHA) protein
VGRSFTMTVNLIVVRGKPQGKSLAFPRGEFVFGRGAECHIRPNSSWVSRQHCLLRVTENAVELRDLGSTNGTLVNGKRLIGQRSLAHGDQIQIGPLVFQVRVSQGETVISDFNLETMESPSMNVDEDPTAMIPKLPDDLL